MAAPVSGSGPRVITSDVELFFRIYDMAHGKPSAQQLQVDYLNAGTDAVRQFIPSRIKSAEALAAEIAAQPGDYQRARECAQVLPMVRTRVAEALDRLQRIYPETITPPVTVLIGRDNSAGTTGQSGVLIGLERVCSANHLQNDVADRLVHLISHEYIHVQQPDTGSHPTVLSQSLNEGVAEFLAEKISGEASESYLQEWVQGHETSIMCAFLAARNSRDLRRWLYNDVGTRAEPGDLGYWAGYVIAKAFYSRSASKRNAIRTLILAQDPEAILQRSGVAALRCGP